jgi:hypothetical protein
VQQCLRIYEECDKTMEILHQKASQVFSLVSVVAPLIVAAAVVAYGRVQLSSNAKIMVAVLFAISAGFIVLAFVAALRAVWVQRRESLGIASVIEPEAAVFRRYDPGYYARGLLYCASVNAAMNGFIALFVKAAQVFIVVAVLSLFAGVAPVLGRVLFSDGAPPQQVSGVIELSPSQIAEVKGAYSRQATEMRSSLEKVNDAIKGFSAQSAELEAIQREQERLREELARVHTAIDKKNSALHGRRE